MHLREVFANVRDVYRAPFDISPKIYTVCYVHNLDTLVVCSTEIYSSKKQNKNGNRVPCLLALSRYQDGWREEARVKLEVDSDRWLMCSKLSESRVLVGAMSSSYMEMFRIEKVFSRDGHTEQTYVYVYFFQFFEY